MRIPTHPNQGGHFQAFLLPIWARLPATDRVGVAAAVLAVAFVLLIVGVRVRQAFDRSAKRRPGALDAERIDPSWFTDHSLDGFPEDAARTILNGPGAPSPDRLYAAWVLARHHPGTSAAWLEKNLSLPADAAHLIVEAAEAAEAGRVKNASKKRPAAL